MNGSNSVAEGWSQPYTPPVAKLMTAEELAELPDDGHLYELVRGELIEVSPSGFHSAEIGLAFGAFLFNFVRQHRLGAVTSGEGGYILARRPDTVRAPDAAFIRADRVPHGADRDFFVRHPPDLAVEVMSRTDRLRDLQAKCLEYLDAGVRLVWLVEPKRQRVTVYLPDRSTRTLGITDTLDGGDVLPGFSLPLAEVFD